MGPQVSGHRIDIILYCACIVHIILWTVDHFCLSFDRLIVYSLKYDVFDVYDALNIIWDLLKHTL